MSTEQEYDTQQSMLDDPDADADGSDPSPDQMQGHFPPHFEHQQQRHQQIPTTSGFYQHPVPQMMPQQQQQMSGASSGTNGGPQFDMIDPSDPLLDADPFGLSASMHYNTSYSFEQPTQR